MNSSKLLDGSLPHLDLARTTFKGDPALRAKVKLLGELPDEQYRDVLAHSAFLWHPAEIDNGTFSVVEAAYFGVPSLSSDYPAMREIDMQFSLGLQFSPPSDEETMARMLKWMEANRAQAVENLPGPDAWEKHGVDAYASHYWAEVRELL